MVGVIKTYKYKRNIDMKLTLKILKYVLILFLVAVCCVSIYILASKLIFKNKNPKVFGYSVMVVKTGSMYPEIKPGDLIIIKTQKQYKTNEIITFEDGNSFTTHRIVEVVEDGFTTKGDANNAPDKAVVKIENIEGKVVGKVGGVGNIAKFLSSTYGIICIVFAGVIVLILGYAINIIKKRNN